MARLATKSSKDSHRKQGLDVAEVAGLEEKDVKVLVVDVIVDANEVALEDTDMC